MDIGLAQPDVDRLCNAGYKTLASFAFSCNYLPGATDDSAFVAMVKQVLQLAADAVPTGAQTACFRRLFWEASVLVTADLKSRAERSDESPIRRLAVPERAHRYAQLKAKLPGMTLEGDLEPSDALVDACVQQYDDNRLSYVPWAACAKKQQELGGIKKEAAFRTDAQGRLCVGTENAAVLADTTTELLLRFALQRRGLAYEMANLMQFELREKWIDELFARRMSEPIRGYDQVSLDQLLNADKALFYKMSMICRTGITPTPLGLRPMEAAIVLAMNHSSVTFLLNALPHSGKSSIAKIQAPAQGVAGQPGLPGQGKKRKRIEAAIARGAVKGAGKTKAPPAAGAKGAGKTKAAASVPAELAHLPLTDSMGQSMCWGFNLGRCPFAAGVCKRGLHACMKCHGPHAYVGSACAE